jgi:hypothetical protein
MRKKPITADKSSIKTTEILNPILSAFSAFSAFHWFKFCFYIQQVADCFAHKMKIAKF